MFTQNSIFTCTELYAANLPSFLVFKKPKIMIIESAETKNQLTLGRIFFDHCVFFLSPISHSITRTHTKPPILLVEFNRHGRTRTQYEWNNFWPYDPSFLFCVLIYWLPTTLHSFSCYTIDSIIKSRWALEIIKESEFITYRKIHSLRGKKVSSWAPQFDWFLYDTDSQLKIWFGF